MIRNMPKYYHITVFKPLYVVGEYIQTKLDWTSIILAVLFYTHNSHKHRRWGGVRISQFYGVSTVLTEHIEIDKFLLEKRVNGQTF